MAIENKLQISRNFYAGILALLLVAGFFLFVYKTSPPAEPVAQPTAQFGGVTLTLDYATTEAERERGLGGRTSISSDYGMLFVFPKDDYYGFWMRDTLVPLDMFWLDSKGHVVYVAQNVATSSYPNVFYPTRPARYVLETVSGFAQEHDITIGTPLILKKFPSVTE